MAGMRAKAKQSAKGFGRPQNKLGGGVVNKFSKGGGKGKPNGQWVFVPSVPTAAKFATKFAPKVARKLAPANRMVQMSGFGKKRHGKGGHSTPVTRNPAPVMKKATWSEKIQNIDASKKVRVGGFPKDITWQQLREHLKQVAHSSVTEVATKGGFACVAFKTKEDAENVIATLNGSELAGKDIKINGWTQKQNAGPKVEGKKGKQVIKTQPLVKSKFAANVAKKLAQRDQKQERGNERMREKLKEVDHSLKTWIGGLSPKTTWKQIKTHFVDAGCKPDLINLLKKDTAVVAFKTADEAEDAISILNGTELDGKTIQVDTWTRPERKERKNKANAD